MVLPELTTYLASDGLGLTAATNLFYGVMPPSPDLCVTLYEYGGRPNEPEMGKQTIRIEYPLVQVAVRGVKNDYDTPRLLLQQIVASLAKIGDTTLSGVRYLAVMAKIAPALLHYDEEFRVIHVCSFEVTKDFSAS